MARKLKIASVFKFNSIKVFGANSSDGRSILHVIPMYVE